MVTAGLVFVVAALLVQFAVVPLLRCPAEVGRAIAASEKMLRELAVLGAEYGVLRQRSEEIRRVIEGGRRGSRSSPTWKSGPATRG